MSPIQRLAWGGRQVLDRGTLFRNGTPFPVPAVRVLTVFGWGLCWHYNVAGGAFVKGPGGVAVRSVTWGQYQWAPAGGRATWNPWRRDPGV